MNNKIERFLKTNKQGIRYFNFDNLHDLSSFILENKEGRSDCFSFKGNRSLESINISDYNTRFSKTKSFEEAVELLKCGWESGAKQMKDVMSIKCKPQSTFKQEYNLVGGQASVPRYLQGVPTNMILNKRVMTDKIKIIDVYKSVVYSAGVKAEQIIEYSVKAVELIDALESQGYRVNLYAVCMMKEESEKAAFRIKIKSSTERINLKQMSFCLAHPSMLRRIILKLVELHPDLTDYGWTVGYGTPTNNEIEIRQAFDMKSTDVFIPNIVKDTKEIMKKYERS